MLRILCDQKKKAKLGCSLWAFQSDLSPPNMETRTFDLWEIQHVARVEEIIKVECEHNVHGKCNCGDQPSATCRGQWGRMYNTCWNTSWFGKETDLECIIIEVWAKNCSIKQYSFTVFVQDFYYKYEMNLLIGEGYLLWRF